MLIFMFKFLCYLKAYLLVAVYVGLTMENIRLLKAISKPVKYNFNDCFVFTWKQTSQTSLL